MSQPTLQQISAQWETNQQESPPEFAFRLISEALAIQKETYALLIDNNYGWTTKIDYHDTYYDNLGDLIREQ